MAESLAQQLRELATLWDPAIHHRELLEEAAGRLERLASAEALAVPPDIYVQDRLWPEMVARMQLAEAPADD
jgi:hypothetical protein